MIVHLKGVVAEKRPDLLVIDVGGIGYGLLCSGTTLASAPATGEKMHCYTRMIVREDAMELYGFSTLSEREWFDRLIGVSSVGPRTALGVLGTLPVKDLALALATGDAKAIQRAPGVGAKTAQRIVLELRDKVTNEELVSAAPAASGIVPPPQSVQRDAIEGLMALGFSQSDAARAVQSFSGETAEDIIMQALRAMGSK